MTLASGGESDVPDCGPPASFSIHHLPVSDVTPAGSVHKSRGDNVVRMWVRLKRCCSETYESNGVTPIFRSFHRTASSTTGGWSRWNILMRLYIYIILSTTVSLFRGYHIIFYRSRFFHCVYISRDDVCECYTGGMVVMDMIWRRLCVNMI